MNPAITPSSDLSRREALKIFGAGAALLGLGAVSAKAGQSMPAAGPGGSPRTAEDTTLLDGTSLRAVSGPTLQPFVLPKLGYAYNALEPSIDAQTMEIHYTKHHQAYITNANKALAGHPDLQKLTGEAILADLGGMPADLRAALRNNVGGHVNHSFFWRSIGPGMGGAADGDLAAAIGKAFGSDAAFRAQFADAAAKRFGSGWAWLSVGKDGKLMVHSTANQDSPISDGAKPILGLDVWEHAYYLKYQNRRPEYVTAFWNVVNWNQAGANYAAAMTA